MLACAVAAVILPPLGAYLVRVPLVSRCLPLVLCCFPRSLDSYVAGKFGSLVQVTDCKEWLLQEVGCNKVAPRQTCCVSISYLILRTCHWFMHLTPE